MIDIPFIEQKEGYDCAKACAASILKLFKFPKKKIAEMVCSPLDGADPRAVEGFYRSLQVNVLSGSMTWDHLKLFGKLKQPVQLLVNFTGSDGHYVLSEGVSHGKINIVDPSQGKYSMGRDDFEAIWLDWDTRFNLAFPQFGIAIWQNE